LGASADTRNHVMNARVRLKVVTHRVFHARPESQSVSGSQDGSQSAPLRIGAVVLIGALLSR